MHFLSVKVFTAHGILGFDFEALFYTLFKPNYGYITLKR